MANDRVRLPRSAGAETMRSVAAFNAELVVVARGSRGITQASLAEQMGWSQGKASKVEHGLTSIDEGEIRKLAAILDYPPSLFLVSSRAEGFGSCCEHHRKRSTTPLKLLNQLHDLINIWRIQIGALLRGIELPHDPTFPAMDVDEFDPETAAQSLRAAWRLPRGPVRDLAGAVERAGGIIMTTDFVTPKIDAVSQWPDGLPPLFFLNRSKPVDRWRFSLAHEIGHIVLHSIPSPNAEKEADRFAAEFLMPRDEIYDELRNLTIPAAARLKLKWRVAIQALIRRAKDLGAITAGRYKSLCVRVSQLGYRKSEPNPLVPEPPKMLRLIIDSYLKGKGYDINELSHVAMALPERFAEDFLRSGEEEATFRVIG